MANIGDVVQKAFYLGLGLASYAGEKAGSTFADLQSQAQTLADEMVARGEMTADEAKRMVDTMVNKAKQSAQSPPSPESSSANAPREIEIVVEDVEQDEAVVDALQDQVAKLREELERLRKQ